MQGSEKIWESYEQIARKVLTDLRQELCLSEVEGKQDLQGASGTSWEVDGKAVLVNGEGFLVVEARRHTTSRLPQEAIAAIAYRIKDVAGQGGIIVSPLPLQKGAEIVAGHENILHVKLAPWSTSENYLAEFLEQAFHHATEHATVSFKEHLRVTVTRNGEVIDDGT